MFSRRAERFTKVEIPFCLAIKRNKAKSTVTYSRKPFARSRYLLSDDVVGWYLEKAWTLPAGLIQAHSPSVASSASASVNNNCNYIHSVSSTDALYRSGISLILPLDGILYR